MARGPRISVEERRLQYAAGVSLPGKLKQIFTPVQLAVLGVVEQKARDGVFNGGLALAAGPVAVSKATALAAIRLGVELGLISYEPGQGPKPAIVRLLWVNQAEGLS
jgi:hypothetical protein